MKFAPEHFPSGTVFRLKDDAHFRRRYGDREFTVQKVCRNGVNSYVLKTTRLHENQDIFPGMYHNFNIDHVEAIVRRGAGPMLIEHDTYPDAAEVVFKDMQRYQNELSPRMYASQPKSSRTHYQILNIEILVRHLVLKFLPDSHHVFDADACRRALMAQSFVHRNCSNSFFTVHWAPKKRVDAWFQANKNRFLYSVKRAQREYDAEMSRIMEEDLDRDMDVLDAALDKPKVQEEGSCYDREDGYRRDEAAWCEAATVLGEKEPFDDSKAPVVKRVKHTVADFAGEPTGEKAR